MVWQQVRDYVLRFALACWVLEVLVLGVVLLLLRSYCRLPSILPGYP
jgi:hypothetical protein